MVRTQAEIPGPTTHIHGSFFDGNRARGRVVSAPFAPGCANGTESPFRTGDFLETPPVARSRSYPYQEAYLRGHRLAALPS